MSEDDKTLSVDDRQQSRRFLEDLLAVLRQAPAPADERLMTLIVEELARLNAADQAESDTKGAAQDSPDFRSSDTTYMPKAED